MKSVMRCFSQYLQVRDLVVPAVPVSVMHDFARQEDSPKISLHHKSVFHDVSLGVGIGMAGDEPCEVSIAASIGDAFPEARVVPPADLCALPRGPTFERAELPGAAASTRDICAAGATYVGGRITPSCGEVALARTEARRLLTTVLRMESGAATLAGARQGASFHARIVARRERYCEIAAKRCAQETLGLGAA